MALTSTDFTVTALSAAAAVLAACFVINNREIEALKQQVKFLSDGPYPADDLVPGERKPPVGRRVGLLRRLGMRLRGEKPILLTRAEPW